MKLLQQLFFAFVFGFVHPAFCQKYKGPLEGKPISIKLPATRGSVPGQFKLRIYSGRNKEITSLSDRSRLAPEEYQYPPMEEGKNIWFPVLDIPLDPSLTAVAQFEGVGRDDSVCFNGNFVEDCRKLEPLMKFEKGLEHWENQLFVSSPTARLKEFYFEKTIGLTAQSEQPATYELTTLAEDWHGLIELYREEGGNQWKKLQTQEVRKQKETDSEQKVAEGQLDKDLLISSLKASVQYLLNSQNQNPLSPTYGGLYLFYDEAAETYRRSDWIWSYGPAIKVLVESAQLPVISESFGYENLSESARLVAEASLRYQQLQPEHPAYGLVMCRFDPRTDSPRGAEGYYSPADSYFLAGWGWIPYYRFTKDQRFLDAAGLMTEQVGRILTYDDIIEQDYLMRKGKWKNWTMDESGFGMQGAAEIFNITQERRHQVIGKLYLDGLLAKLEREDGLWDRTWHRNRLDHADNGWPVGAPKGEGVLIETAYSTRGLGWAMIGLLAAHRMMPEGGVYLEKAEKMAAHLLEHQQPEGHWEFLFANNPYEGEISEKGTALWCLLFYNLYSFTKRDAYLQAARKALLWCIRHQERNTHAHSTGGIVGLNRESGVVYRRWYPLNCSYTVSWFGLALLEELKLAKVKKPN